MPGIHHIAITVSDMNKSSRFYDGILRSAGYTRHLSRETLSSWQGPGPELLVYKSRPEDGPGNSNIYSPGLHHLALQVDSAQDVDEAYHFAVDEGFAVLDPPTRYDHYSEGYYAAFFRDPDGSKIEIAFIPVPTS